MRINAKAMFLMFLTAAVPGAGLLYSVKSDQIKEHEYSVAEAEQEAKKPANDIEYDEPKISGSGWDSPYIPANDYTAADIGDVGDTSQNFNSSSQRNPAFDEVIEAARRAGAAAQDAEDAATRVVNDAKSKNAATETYGNGVRQSRP